MENSSLYMLIMLFKESLSCLKGKNILEDLYAETLWLEKNKNLL